MRLLLIRHGETPSNVLGALDTAAPGPELTALGRAQAEAVPQALADTSIAGLYVSALVRTELTAAPLAAARDLRPRAHAGLNEISAGSLEMHTDAAAVRTYVACVQAWGHGDLAPTLPGGEDGYAFRARFEAALTEIAESHADDATIAVVSHGAAIRVYAALAADLIRAGVEERGLLNTGMVTLAGRPGRGWELVDWVEHPIGGRHLTGDGDHDVTADPDATPLGESPASESLPRSPAG